MMCCGQGEGNTGGVAVRGKAKLVMCCGQGEGKTGDVLRSGEGKPGDVLRSRERQNW